MVCESEAAMIECHLVKRVPSTARFAPKEFHWRRLLDCLTGWLQSHLR
jgi:hypothetical protein